MNEVSDPRYRFGAAAHGIGVTAKTLRNWLQRNQIELLTPRGEDEAQFRFSAGDVLILSAVAELVRYCVPVRLAFESLDPLRRQVSALTMFKRTPLAALFAAVTPFRILAHHTGREWLIECVPESGSTQLEARPSILVISVAACLGAVLNRLAILDETVEAIRTLQGDEAADEAFTTMTEGLPDDVEFGPPVPFRDTDA